MKKLAYLVLLSLCSGALAQNWIARMASSEAPESLYKTQNGPTNWAVEWINVGTNLTVASYFNHPTIGSNYTFVGNQAAKDAFIAAQQTTTWNNWNTATGGVFAANLDRTNSLLSISNNLLTVQRLFQSNIAFVSMVATNPNAVTFTNNNLVISNQIVTLSRLFNQIAPMLKMTYKGE